MVFYTIIMYYDISVRIKIGYNKIWYEIFREKGKCRIFGVKMFFVEI